MRACVRARVCACVRACVYLNFEDTGTVYPLLAVITHQFNSLIILLTEHNGQLMLKVIVSHIEDPGEFYVQHCSDHHNLTTLMTQLAEHCNSSHTPVKFSSGM